MGARPKLTQARQDRLLGILGIGEPLTAACRAVGVTNTAVYKRAAHDPAFGERLRAARQSRQVPSPEEDWRTIAGRLAAQAPDHWAPLSLAESWDIGEPGV